jgi:hypothetical protein
VVSPQEAALARAFALLVSSLHAAGLVDGAKLAANLRLDRSGDAAVDAFALELADVIRRTIDPASPRLHGLRDVAGR